MFWDNGYILLYRPELRFYDDELAAQLSEIAASVKLGSNRPA